MFSPNPLVYYFRDMYLLIWHLSSSLDVELFLIPYYYGLISDHACSFPQSCSSWSLVLFPQYFSSCMQLYPSDYHICVSSLFPSVCDFTLCIILFLTWYKLMIVPFNCSFFMLMDLSKLYQITEIIALWFLLWSIFLEVLICSFPPFHMHCACIALGVFQTATGTSMKIDHSSSVFLGFMLERSWSKIKRMNK